MVRLIGMYLSVQVKPGAKQNQVKRLGPDKFWISTKAPAERQLANQAVKRLLADYLNYPPTKLRLLIGQRSSKKIFVIND